jgi:membrane-bound ClpP family serine protease
MTIAFVFLILGLLLIFLEFILPGIVMGVMGGLLVLASLIIFALQSNSAIETLLYIVGTAICVGFIIKFALWRIPRAKSKYSIYLHRDQEGYQASEYDKSAIGKKGVVLSDLKPGGYILIEGKSHQAISLSGYITKGTEVIVVSGQEESLIVKNIKKEMS